MEASQCCHCEILRKHQSLRALHSNSPTLANPYCRWNLSKILLFLCLILWNRFRFLYCCLFKLRESMIFYLFYLRFYGLLRAYALAKTVRGSGNAIISSLRDLTKSSRGNLFRYFYKIAGIFKNIL